MAQGMQQPNVGNFLFFDVRKRSFDHWEINCVDFVYIDSKLNVAIEAGVMYCTVADGETNWITC